MAIGKIQRLKLREVWKHEAHDFTQWLEDNIDVLSDALDLTLVKVEREKSVGTFNVDLVAESESGEFVVIENQLEKSDHDHLGKLITYLTSLDAKVAIWIVAAPRPEHIRAVSWLNETSSAAFYLVKIEAIRIAESPPAALLTLITGPSEEAKEVGSAKKELAERHVRRKRFWTGLLERSKPRTKILAGVSAGPSGWLGSSAGLPTGLSLNYAVRQHDAQGELYIDRDRENGEGNKQILEQLKANQHEIESTFGGDLEWESLEGKRACRIRKTISGGGWRDEETWPAVHEELVSSMIRLEQALSPHLQEVR